MAKAAVEVFRELAKHRELCSANILSSTDDAVVVDSKWSQRLIKKCEHQSLRRSHTLRADTLKQIATAGPYLNDDGLWKVPSPSGKFYLYVRKPTQKDKEKSSDEGCYFEVWDTDGCCERVVNVMDSEKHGAVYGDDGAFGSVQWNQSEDKILYIAEKKIAKSTSYFDEEKKDGGSTAPTVKGEKFAFREDWGEQLAGKYVPVVCVLDLPTGQVTVVDSGLQDMSCGQAVWSPDGKGIVLVAYSHTPIRLGIVHCPIRRTGMKDLITLLGQLSEEGELSVRCPRFSPNGSKLVFMQCSAGGPHSKCTKLQMIDWPTRAQSTLVDVVYSPKPDDTFQGLFGPDLSHRCWSEDNSHIFLTSVNRSSKDIFTVDVTSRQIRRLTDGAGAWSVLDVYKNLVLAKFSSLNTPPRLVIGRVSGVNGSRNVQWQYLDKAAEVTGISYKTIQHTPRVPDPTYPNLTYETLLLFPTEQKSKALIVFPHGGPHSAFVNLYQIYFASLAKIGFTVALINYRGSTGFGEDFVNALIGHIGDYDVKDVQQAAEEIIEQYNMDKERVVALGGSHGGFLVAHLIGQYPDFYKAAVMRNPVTNMVAMVALSDIPDWSHTESGIADYTLGKVPTSEFYTKMYNMSPVAHIDNVKTPTMIMLGQDDRRVPPCVGVEFHKALLSKGVETRLMMYPGNGHPIETVEAESDSFINLTLWFLNHL